MTGEESRNRGSLCAWGRETEVLCVTGEESRNRGSLCAWGREQKQRFSVCLVKRAETEVLCVTGEGSRNRFEVVLVTGDVLVMGMPETGVVLQ